MSKQSLRAPSASSDSDRSPADPARSPAGPGPALGNAFLQDLTRGAASAVPYADDMAHAFGADFGGVRAFLGMGPAMGPLGAPAAAGDDAVFFQESSPSRERVAHELTHIVQARRFGTSDADFSAPGDASEREADQLAAAAARGQPVTVAQGASGALSGDWPTNRRLPEVAPTERRVSQVSDLEDGHDFSRSRRRSRLDWDANNPGVSPTDAQPTETQDHPMTLRESAWTARDRLIQEDTGFSDARTMQQHIDHLRREGASEAEQGEAAELEARLHVLEQNAVVQTLNPEGSNRYQPYTRTLERDGAETTDHPTNCNIYARDYADMLGAPLPYTVDMNGPDREGGTRELNANEMNDYLRHPDSQERSGWRQVPIDEAQGEANQGQVVVISARNRTASRSGHIGSVLGEREGRGTEGINQTMAGRAPDHMVNEGDLGGHAWWSDHQHQGDTAGAWVYDGERQETIFDHAPETYVPPSVRAEQEAQRRAQAAQEPDGSAAE